MTDESATGTEELEPDPDGAKEAAPPQEGDPAGPPVVVDADQSDEPTPPRQTFAGRVWAGIIVAVILLVLLIIFVAENSHKVTVKFLGASGTLSLGLMMLVAAVVGALITLLVGTTRMVQLRREVHRQNRKAQASD
jgi:uncharacterized integral membrane protein